MTAALRQTEFNETQQRILDAAIRCVRQWGIDKTSLNDIAKMAGVTRPTVYSYFGSRNQMLTAALLQSGYALGQRMLEHMSRFDSYEERYVETVLFALEELPKEPYLGVITRADLSSYVSEDALSNVEGWALTKMLMRQVFLKLRIGERELEEITEMTTRFVVSMLMMRGPKTRSAAELRGFVVRRLLPTAASVLKADRPGVSGA